MLFVWQQKQNIYKSTSVNSVCCDFDQILGSIVLTQQKYQAGARLSYNEESLEGLCWDYLSKTYSVRNKESLFQCIPILECNIRSHIEFLYLRSQGGDWLIWSMGEWGRLSSQLKIPLFISHIWRYKHTEFRGEASIICSIYHKYIVYSLNIVGWIVFQLNLFIFRSQMLEALARHLKQFAERNNKV